MNHSEWIAYWYLRLNGFFLVHNFVIHRIPPYGRSTEIDLLGIRPPHVYEEVGGRDADWDIKLFDEWGISLPDSIVCVIIESKTGAFSPEALE